MGNERATADDPFLGSSRFHRRPALVGVGFNRFCDRHLCVAACHLRRVGIGPHQFSDALLVELLCEPVIFSPERFPDLCTVKNAPLRLMPMVSSKKASLTCSTGRNLPMPALMKRDRK